MPEGQMGTTPILLLTRPKGQSDSFAQACREAGFKGDIVISPILEIVGRPLAARPAPGTTLIFTSANGVHHGAVQADLRGFHAFAVGDTTAQAAQAAGMICISAGGDVEALLAALQGHDGPLLHLRGAHAAGDLVRRLRAKGRVADEAVVYDQRPCALSPPALARLGGTHPVIVPLFSPRSAQLMRTAALGATAPLHPIAISTAAASAWGQSDSITLAASPDAAAMLRAICTVTGKM